MAQKPTKADDRTMSRFLTSNNTKSKTQTITSAPKRPHSEVANSSAEELQMLMHELSEIKNEIKETIRKEDLEITVTRVVERLLNNMVSEMDAKFMQKFDCLKMESETRAAKLQDQVDSLQMENEQLKEVMRKKDQEMKKMNELLKQNDYYSKETMRSCNHNEQYSRKTNIRALNIIEKKEENLREIFIDMLQKEAKLNIEPTDIQAIHRIPGKQGSPRPVIIKLRNTDIKRTIMRKKRELKSGARLYDDITLKNLTLLNKLKQHEHVESAWFFNCNVYCQLKNGNRIKVHM
ncbi:uncharacterized protein LOC106172561 [Lingula anatina]|uniref:Uncharacterized protein LOC106172561 n=1 Tax=Lingula anatina TaxID=7574 RepID=A0A1S3JEF0_LINAN|nr:uncharacterized protein LOC106172561 [Lingula anatina]|eukprot:XP_013408787.1 uncharacterized protein LOC106172561 [Lingula anatina]